MTEVEYTAASAKSWNLRWLERLAFELLITLTNETCVDTDGSKTPFLTLFVDNEGMVDIANGLYLTKGTHHMEVWTMLLEEQAHRVELLFKQVPTTLKLEDCMTTPLGSV